MQGKIIRGIGGFYYVHTHQGVYECRARGIFRKDKEKPLPGDLVSISVLDETEKKGNLDEILPRTNSLIRPAVANGIKCGSGACHFCTCESQTEL